MAIEQIVDEVLKVLTGLVGPKCTKTKMSMKRQCNFSE